jgi:hypothetical protein
MSGVGDAALLVGPLEFPVTEPGWTVDRKISDEGRIVLEEIGEAVLVLELPLGGLTVFCGID